ncbi:Nn.00g105020.m01.CDS01 [Neocucurbitaria sp. VM-36]
MAANVFPELNNDEFKLYNKMAAGMDVFHSGFRAEWEKIYAIGNGGLHSTTPADFMTMVLEWCRGLDQHHSLEEEHVFPKLAVKMPAFRKDKSGEQSLSGPGYVHEQHRQIHAGLDILHDHVKTWLAAGKNEVDWEHVRKLIDSFGAILWKHMDEEVETLGAANMRLYWTLDEMKQLPFKVKN